MKFYNWNDPLSDQLHVWHFVYYHGQLEELNERVGEERGLEWAAPDLVLCDEPMPAEGIYKGTHYGTPVVAVLSHTRQTHLGIFLLPGGRVAVDDPKAAGYDHVFRVEDWR